MTEQLGDSPIEPGYRRLMNDIATALDQAFNGDLLGNVTPRQTGFVLLVFPFGSDDGRINYISNGADRKDVVKMFKELIPQFEGVEE